VVEFITYGKSTDIDVSGDHRHINNLTAAYDFADYKELFKAANLTNRIKDILQYKESDSATPFKISTL
jgi:hypothetical protein